MGEGGVPGSVAVVWLALEGLLGLCEMGSVVDDGWLGVTEGLVETGILVLSERSEGVKRETDGAFKEIVHDIDDEGMKVDEEAVVVVQ